VELLEDRFLPSVDLNLMEFHDPSRIPAGLKASRLGILPMDNGLQFPVGYLPTDIQTGYGINKIIFGSVVGDGTGQTIAIVDAYDDPAFVNSTAAGFATSDLAQFDAQVGISDPPSFTKVNEDGQTSPLPKTDPAGAGNANGNWEIEEALDIEWAHGIAPGASIILVEATTDSNADLFTAVATAAALPGVSAVSMSWGLNEFSGENAQDSTFVTPSGHQGVTFLASSGDFGGFAYDNTTGQPTTTPGILYPAASPNVVAVGGTSLQLNADSTYSSETAWSGSGGGTSLYETQPTYQKGAQQTGFRTTPDVAFDADPNTGVAVYDSYNNTDNSGPWVEVGGTSLSAPSWAGLIAIANQGRVLAGGSTLDGPSQTLPALYAIPATDFNDITSGSNGVFSAGIGYDEVTGLGSPNAPGLEAALSTFGTATHMGVTSQPPSNVIVGDRFGIVVEAEDPQGGLDPAFNGTLTISLDTNHPGTTLGGTLTATASDGVAVFDGLTLNQAGTGFTLQITSSKFPSITTSSFSAIPDPTPWQGTFYPVPTDASLRTAIALADSNASAFNTIILSSSTYLLSDMTAGGLVIGNTSSLPSKTLTITGQGQTSSIIGSVFNWHSRIFEIEGSGGQSLNVILQDLTIEGGNALNGGVLGGSNALGGGLLIDDANVTLTNDAVQNNVAQGAPGAAGAAGAIGAAGGAGGNADNASGGGIYLASGTLSLFTDTISGNAARGGMGGMGGMGGGQGAKSAPAVTPGPGGPGGNGGSGAGGGIYAAGGTVLLQNDTFRSNQAVGGPGGTGGTGGSGGHGKDSPPVPGKPGAIGGAGGRGGAAYGGAIYLAGGSLTLTGTTLQKNSALGGPGGQGGVGGAGTALVSITGIFGGTGSTLNLGGFTGFSGGGGPGGSGGPGGMGGAGSGGGIYVSSGSLTLVNATLAGNLATGGQGGLGGRGGSGGFGAGTLTFGLPVGKTAGNGGTGGAGGSGHGGGILVAGGTVVLSADTLNANIAAGGQGGKGGPGGEGPIAALGTGSLGLGTSLTGGTGLGGGTANGGNSAGAGGNGGNGGTGNGGGIYISGGALTLTNATVAGNTAAAGAIGTGGQGGRAGTGALTGGPGIAGIPGDSYGGGVYVNGGTVTLNNSTVALNIQNGVGSGGGAVVQSPGAVTAVSTLFADNGPVNFSGTITATDSLFQTAPINGTLSGSGNVVGMDPLLAANGLQNNGGPTQTIVLQALSPAIGKGADPENLFADQRGYGPRTGSGGTDIGAYQANAQTDTQAPTATLQANPVTDGSATSYTFTITYSDNVAVAATTLSGAVVQVLPPGSGAPIPATVESTMAVGATDGLGNGPSFIVTYQITPPGGAWTSADNGNYTVTLGGGTVTDLAGNPVATGTLGTFSVSASTTKFDVSASSTATAGTSFSITVTAVDGSNNTQTNYTGTVQFTSSDGNATLPANYTFTAGDHGVHTFSVTLKTAGTQSITATDTVTSSITGSQTGITVNAGALSALQVSGFPSPVTAGTASTFTVKAVDAYGNTVTSYRDAVTFTSADTKASLPSNYTFTSTDQGIHTFTATLKTAGTKSITATDRTISSIKGSESGILVNPGIAVALTVTVFPSSTTAGVIHTIGATAVDAFGNAATSYRGTIHFTSTDPQAVLPANYTFLASDGGAHSFQASTTLKTAGLQSITATDTVTSSITGSETKINVTPAAAHTLTVAGFPSPAFAGISSTFTITAKDIYGNTATGYTGTVAFTSSDPLAVLPGHSTLTSGVGTFSATLNTLGTQSITATDTVTSSIKGSQTGITVTSSATVVAKFLVTGFAASVTAGSAGTITVTAENPFGQTVTSYIGSVHFTSSDGQAALPANYTFTAADNGVHTFSVTLKTVGTRSVTATDAVTGSITGSQTGITVNPAAASTFVVSGFPSSMVVGAPGNFTVTAKDPYNNTATGYTGTVAFSSSDPSATLPGHSTLTNGTGTFSATFNTLGTQSLTATDTVTASITGSQTGIMVITQAEAVAKFVITGFPTSITAGNAGTITVTAENSSGQTLTTYTGTVYFTSSDGQAGLPANYTFTSGDNGVHTFSVTLKTAGTQSITATDTVTSSVTGSQTGITVNAAAASALVVSGFPSPVTAGTAGGFTVEAVDAYGNLAASYRGTVAFSSTDAKAILPSNYTFTSADQGLHTFSATLKTSGTKSITAKDKTTSTITGTDSIIVNAGAAIALTVTVFPSPDTAGATHTLALTAVDAYGNAATGYRGTIHFTSTDPQAVLPANYTFVASDNGVHSFQSSTTLKTAGKQSITATDTVTSSITGSETNITVNPSTAVVLVVSGFPTSVVAGTAETFTVAARDAYGNIATGYTGTVHFTSSDGAAALPANYTFTAADNGSHTFTATLNTIGTQSIMATDTSKSTITGTESGIQVTAATLDILFQDWSDKDDVSDGVPDLMEARAVLEQVACATAKPASLLDAVHHDSVIGEGAGIANPQASWASAALGLFWWSRPAESKEDRRRRRDIKGVRTLFRV